MGKGIRPTAVNHMNVVLEDFEASVAHFHKVYGGVFLHRIPREDFQAGLFEVGGLMYELFVPKAFLFNLR
jgi:hypothetical protein